MSLETTYTCYKLNIYTSAKYIRTVKLYTYVRIYSVHMTIILGMVEWGNIWGPYVKERGKVKWSVRELRIFCMDTCKYFC